ncbi:UDP-2,3-diacylglucosamine hydrolase [Pasteurella multocida]|nr:UDP-2,3-diacylglucosamine hydrolase [Pasteurella multocida]
MSILTLCYRLLPNLALKKIIHGHTHRQHIHHIPPHFTRIVLGDWGDTASILEVNEQQQVRFLTGKE